MLALYVVSCVFLALSGVGIFISLLIAGIDCFEYFGENMALIICGVVLALSIIGVCTTYNSDAVIKADYSTKVSAIKDAENDLEKFLVDHPQFREEYYGKESNSNK